jgi:cyclophilin family peptidyl-prolyl cis-trans isomerase
MKLIKLIASSVLALGLASAALAQSAPVKVAISTSLGDIKLELDGDKAPVTVKNFVSYVEKKHYDGTIFHRVIAGFMVQGGGFGADMAEKSTGTPIKLESANGLKNMRGTIAMARTSVPDSATAQFFINVVDNDFLNYRKYEEDTVEQTRNGPVTVPKGTQRDGYAVFGKVTEGMDVVDKIRNVPVGVKPTRNGNMPNVPNEPVTIKSIRIIK